MNRLAPRLAAVLAFLSLTAVSHAVLITYSTTLSGAAEIPSNASPGTGTGKLTYDTDYHLLQVEMAFENLMGSTTASHIHAPTAVAGAGPATVATQTPTFTGFPTGVTSGSYNHVLDLTLTSSFNSSFILAYGGTAAGAEAALLSFLDAGKAYLNIHTSNYPGGEIRGFFARDVQNVPDAGATGLMLAPLLLALGAFGRRQIRSAV